LMVKFESAVLHKKTDGHEWLVLEAEGIMPILIRL